MGDQYSGDEVRWDWLGCESGCSMSHGSGLVLAASGLG